MVRYFRLKLTITLISFSLIITIASALFDYNKLKDELRAGHEKSVAGDRLDSLYDRADQALYHSKENGKNQFTFYNEEWVHTDD